MPHYRPGGVGTPPRNAGTIWVSIQNRTRNTNWKRIGKWVLVIAILLFILLGAGSCAKACFGGGKTSETPSLKVTTAWSEPVRVLPGQQVTWAPRENAQFEVRIQTGATYTIPRLPETGHPCETHVRIEEAISSFQLRLKDTEVKETVFDLIFSPYTSGGPCAGYKKEEIEVSPPSPGPERTPPPSFFLPKQGKKV